MKVGDLVARSYSWPELLCGMIIDLHEDLSTIEDYKLSYVEKTFTVAWADGSITRESDLELVHFEQIFNKP